MVNAITTTGTLLAKSQLANLPTSQQNSRLLRRFLRLSQFIPKRKHQLIYNNYLKLKFNHPNHTYDHRLKLILGQETNKESLDRQIGTLELLNKAATFTPKYEMESKVLMNLLMFEESKMRLIERLRKKDRVIDYYVERMDYFKDSNSEFDSIREMERYIMRFNEVEGTCI